VTSRNIDPKTVAGFGEEWSTFDQSTLSPSEQESIFLQYFAIFPWDQIPINAVGFDLGCGSGRWARLVARRVGNLHCIDVSSAALDVARRNLAGEARCVFHEASVDAIPLPDSSMDFGYSLGVLHHIPDPAAGITSCAAKLKTNAPFLVYLYYAFDNRPWWFRQIWRMTDILRKFVCRLPKRARVGVTTAIAGIVYYPTARTLLLLEKLGMKVDPLPLAAYRQLSFYTMRTDALDRFGTRLEFRFTKNQIRTMMEAAGLERITFSSGPPYWCAVGYKSSPPPENLKS
jgi:ubiquinone/menaquinone biosynthesis C-methylase UbiE